MQWTEIKTGWKDVQKSFQAKWPKLEQVDLTAIAGKREELITRLVKHYKTDRVKLEKEVEDFIKTLKVKL